MLWHVCCAFCVVVAYMLTILLWCYDAFAVHFLVLLLHVYMCSASCDVMAHIYSLHLVMLGCICSAFCCDITSHIYALNLVVMLWHIYMLSILLWYYDAYVVHFVTMLWHICVLCILLWCRGLCVLHFVVILCVSPPDYVPAMAAAVDACDCVMRKWSAVVCVS